MFSTGQIGFTFFFVAVFVTALILVYKKDLKQLRLQYKGTKWVLAGFLLFIASLFLIKSFLKE